MFAKKNLVAAAALLALVGAAQAQSSVKLYGYVEAAVGSFKSVGAESSVTKVQSGDMMTSFIGFSGVEDLGGGLKAEFALESFLGVDSGANIGNQAEKWWGRASWVGLSGGFGRVILGQYDAPLFVAGLSYNPFGSSMTYSPTMRHFYDLGSTRNFDAATRATTNLSLTDTGSVNSVTYETPNIAGLTATVQFGAKESAPSTDDNFFAVGVAYNAGPLSVMGTYTSGGKSTESNAGAASYPNPFKAANLNASYDFGVLKAFGQYTRFMYDSTSLQTVGTGAGTLSGIEKANVWQLGVSVPVTASGSVLASYGSAKYKAAADDATSRILSLGYDHALSKRTSAYAAVSTEKLTDNKGGRAIAVGVKHSF